VASWRAEPQRIGGEWSCFRQVDPQWPPLYHQAGEPVATQSAGRWHREGERYAQYLSLEPLGAWAELVRYENIRTDERARQYTRALWLVFVREHDIADLSSDAHYRRCGLNPRIAVGPHEDAQELADDLRAAGFRGLLSPSAALPGATNLTLFGPRFERVLLGRLADWDNPNADVWLPCTLAAEGHPPPGLVADTVFLGEG
jgi:RES domain